MSSNVPRDWNVPRNTGQRDVADLVHRLETWLAGRLNGRYPVHVSDVTWPEGAGVSNETILFTASWREGDDGGRRDLVLRIRPGNFQLFRDAAFDMQYRLLQALHADGSVPVAEPLWYEPDTFLLGQPFFVMSRLQGRVPVSYPPYNATGWLFDAAPADRALLWHRSMQALARIHALPVSVFSILDKPDLGATGFDQQLEHWLRSHAWACDGREYPALEETRSWLLANLPADRPTGLSWGDARIGNMMYADDFTVSGVMDWEQASLGGAMQDLGWWTFFDMLHSRCMGLKRLDGLGSEQETLAVWEGLTGRRVTDLHWYQIFSGYKLGLIVARRLHITGKLVPGYNINNNSWTRLAAELTGAAMPLDML